VQISGCGEQQGRLAAYETIYRTLIEKNSFEENEIFSLKIKEPSWYSNGLIKIEIPIERG
jgi:hypothetical protein